MLDEEFWLGVIAGLTVVLVVVLVVRL